MRVLSGWLLFYLYHVLCGDSAPWEKLLENPLICPVQGYCVVILLDRRIFQLSYLVIMRLR